MAEIGYGYGSECHLLRWMGRHRQVFGQAVKSVMETKSPITWLDFNFDPKKTWADAELKGLNFLTKDQKLQYEWKQWWPQTGNSMNWDAVGWLGSPENKTPILIEAKAHLGELKSKCGASESSLNQITRALKETGKFISAPFNDTWLDPHYQFTNRLAVLYFLRQRGYTPHLVNVYFVGDFTTVPLK